MTEGEAKTKWCFHFTASHTDPRAQQSEYGIEHGQPGPFAYHCIASACMAWRALPTAAKVHRRNSDGSDSYSFPAPDASAFLSRPGEFRVEPAAPGGYCGLAGSPS